MRNYTLGRGRFFFDKFSNVDLRTLSGERYVGNTPAFGLSVESEDLDHMNSDEGINVIDDSVQLSVSYGGSLECDDILAENIAIFFQGASSIISQTADPVVAQDLNYGNAVLGDRYYQIGATASNLAGIRDVSAVTIKDKATGTVTYVLGTDYTLDAALGRIYVIEGSSLDGVAATADYTPAAKDIERVVSSRNGVYGAGRFIASNPKGANKDYYLPFMKLSPNGEYSLKGDEWLKMGFSLKIMEPAYNEPAIYCDGRPYTP